MRTEDPIPTDDLVYWRAQGLDVLLAEFDGRRFRGRRPPSKPIAPAVADLVRLHRLVRLRRCAGILEFGVGYSTLVLADALARNATDDAEAPANPPLRRAHAFELFSVDANKAWLATVRRGLPSHLRKRVRLRYSTVSATTFSGRVCHLYDRLPDVTPDLVYVDGPDPRDVAGRVHGIGFRGAGRVPLAADLLLLEPLLLPRTLILFDGRVANARFVARNLQRDWEMRRDREADVTFLELMEEPLGRHDERRLAQVPASTRSGRRRAA